MSYSGITYDWIPSQELDDAYKIEKRRYRQTNAPHLFLGAYLPPPTAAGESSRTPGRRTLIGLISGTRSALPTLAHASMTTHDPAGASVCIHSVCVARAHTRRGVATALLREYVARLDARAAAEGLARVLLITHVELRALYERAGFEWRGESAVVHGPRAWFEMRRELGAGAGAEAAQAITSTAAPTATGEDAAGQPAALPANVDLWAALQQASSRTRPAARLLASFAQGVQDVSAGAPPENKYDLLCPRDGCGSVVLKAGVAHLVERASVLMEPPAPAHTPHPALPALPAPPAPTHWWLVSGTAMEFENVGFTRPVPGSVAAEGGRRMKLLTCAECDLGPLGWCEEGGREFWVYVGRVGYRA